MTEKYSFKGKLEQFTDSPLWNLHIQIPNEVSLELLKVNKRVICELPNKVIIQIALMSSGDGFQFININKEVKKQIKIEIGDEIHVVISNDVSEYGIFVPEVFTEMCSQDPEGYKVFHQLTIGKQRSLLHIMAKPKSETKQLEKTLIIFDYLKSVNGNLDFKELMLAFKENNRFK